MSTILLATDSVHTSAAAADALEGRLSPDDTVLVLGVEEDRTGDGPPLGAGAGRGLRPGESARDVGDAANAALVRLQAGATVESMVRGGDPAAEILTLADERDVDEVVIGPGSGAPGGGSDVGETARAVIAGATRPVLVVPLPDLS